MAPQTSQAEERQRSAAGRAKSPGLPVQRRVPCCPLAREEKVLKKGQGTRSSPLIAEWMLFPWQPARSPVAKEAARQAWHPHDNCPLRPRRRYFLGDSGEGRGRTQTLAFWAVGGLCR